MDEADYSSFVTPAKPSGFLNALLSLRTHIATSLFTSQVYYHLIEALFFLLIIYLVFTRAYKPWARNSAPSLSAAEKAARLKAWAPAPLTALPINYGGSSSTSSMSKAKSDPDFASEVQPWLSSSSMNSIQLASQTANIDLEIESGGAGPVVKLRDHGEVINVATTNFLGLLKDKRVEEAALDVMKDYGCGACGPRGFYGTTEVHLECEAALASFCETSTAILYSFGAATASSTIPAFVKRGDLLIVDDAMSYPLRVGAKLSRARVIPFRHNNMADLRRVLETAVAKESPQAALTQRRLILVEGISSTCGDVCPLDEVVKLKEEFKFRLLVDESFSFGVLGMSGKGALQEFNVARKDVEFATADLGNAIASVGGFCVGREDVVDHQRLSGAGYCFSASQPPFLAKAATTAVQMLTNEGHSLISKLRSRIDSFHTLIAPHADALHQAGWQFGSDRRSPIVLFSRTAGDLDVESFVRIQERCLRKGILITPPLLPPDDPLSLPRETGESHNLYGKPVLRVAVSAAHSIEQLRDTAEVLSEALLEEVS